MKFINRLLNRNYMRIDFNELAKTMPYSDSQASFEYTCPGGEMFEIAIVRLNGSPAPKVKS